MKVFLIIVIVMVVLLFGALGWVVLDKYINGSESGGSDATAESSRIDESEAKVETVDRYSLKDAASDIDAVIANRVCDY